MANPYEGFIQWINEHSEYPCDVYIQGEEEAWELERIAVILETPAKVFIGGVNNVDGSHVLIGLDKVSVLSFDMGEGDGKGRHDIPEPEKKSPNLTQLSEISRVVNQ